MNNKVAFFLAGLVWFLIGTLLMVRGLKIIHALIETQGDFLVFSMLGAKDKTIEFKAYLSISLAVLIGFIKSNIVFRKLIAENCMRLLKLDTITPFRIFPKSSWILMAVMMVMGMTLRFLPIPKDIYAMIVLAVGVALIQGAIFYFRNITLMKRES